MLYFKAIPNSIDFYKGILRVIPIRIIVSIFPTIKVFWIPHAPLAKDEFSNTSKLIAGKEKNEINVLLQSDKDFCHWLSENHKKRKIFIIEKFEKFSKTICLFLKQFFTESRHPPPSSSSSFLCSLAPSLLSLSLTSPPLSSSLV